MSFDTDYLNSQKEKLNESISNCIRLTYLVSIRWLADKRCCCFQTFKDLEPTFVDFADDKISNLQAFRLIYFGVKSFVTDSLVSIGSANVQGFFVLPNLIS